MDENKVKHLEFIQLNIARMNQNSFHMKGWTIAVLSALLAIYAASIGSQGGGNICFLFVAIVPTCLFWLLDSYYLQQERKFRGIYNDIAKLTEETHQIHVREFEMPLDKYSKGKYAFIKVIWSKTLSLFYVTIICGLVVGGLLLKGLYVSK